MIEEAAYLAEISRDVISSNEMSTKPSSMAMVKCRLGELGWDSIKRTIKNTTSRLESERSISSELQPTLIIEPGKINSPFMIFYVMYALYSLLYIISLTPSSSFSSCDRLLYTLSLLFIVLRILFEKYIEKIKLKWIPISLIAISDTAFLLAVFFIEHAIGEDAILAALMLLTISFKVIVLGTPTNSFAIALVYLFNFIDLSVGVYFFQTYYAFFFIAFVIVILWAALISRTLGNINQR